MALETLNCGNCGAPLRVPESAQFVTCNHCRSSLAIRRMDSVTLTERVTVTEDKLEKVESELAGLVHQNRISEEHRRWERERSRLLFKDKSGNLIVPTMGGGYFALLIGLGMAVFAGMNGFGGFSILPAAVGIIALIATGQKVSEYQLANWQHKNRLREINEDTADSPSTSQLLRQLNCAPTPDDYLRNLSAEEVSS